MFNTVDKWLDNRLTQWNINITHYVVRCCIFLVGISISLFTIALSISFFAIAASLWGTLNGVAAAALVMGLLILVKGIFIILYSAHLANRWLRQDVNDSLATKEDMRQLREELSQKMSALSRQVNENHSDMLRINAGLVLGMKDMTGDLADKVRTFRKELNDSGEKK